MALILLSTLIPYSMVRIPQLGIIIGTTKFACFPILQYLPFFLMGMYCQAKNMFYNRYLVFVASLFTVVVSVYCISCHKIPERFPPSMGWILWASAFTILYYMVSDRISRFKLNRTITNTIRIFGAYTLDFLVISNIIIFAIRWYFGKQLSVIYCFFVIILLYIICYFYGYVKLKRKNTFTIS